LRQKPSHGKASQVKRFEETHATANLEAFRPCQFAGVVIIEQQGIRLDFFAKKNCAEFSNTQSVPFLRRQQFRLILKLLYLDPFRLRNFRCPWQAGGGDDHFVVNFAGDVKAWIEPIEEVEAAKLRQNNQRG
jgi:hypothetical protein